MKHQLAERLPDQLARRLERSILLGEWRPGQRLPAERAWALELGVSRGGSRQAR